MTAPSRLKKLFYGFILQKVLACRSKLVSYDRSQLEASGVTPSGYCFPLQDVPMQTEPVQTKCYGCALSATEHCLILLRALAINSRSRQLLCDHGLIQELVEHNLRRGSTQVSNFLWHLKITAVSSLNNTSKCYG